MNLFLNEKNNLTRVQIDYGSKSNKNNLPTEHISFEGHRSDEVSDLIKKALHLAITEYYTILKPYGIEYNPFDKIRTRMAIRIATGEKNGVSESISLCGFKPKDIKRIVLNYYFTTQTNLKVGDKRGEDENEVEYEFQIGFEKLA